MQADESVLKTTLSSSRYLFILYPEAVRTRQEHAYADLSEMRKNTDREDRQHYRRVYRRLV